MVALLHSSRWRTAIYCGAIVAAIVAIFGRIVAHDFVTLDDPINVTENPYFQPVSLNNVAQLWASGGYRNLYIPVAYTFLAAESVLAARPASDGEGYDFEPRVFHFGSLVLHAACGLLAFAVLKRLVRDGAAACCGAVLFALHPLQTEAVAWVTETRGLLCWFFSLIAIWFFLIFSGTATTSVETGAHESKKGHNRFTWWIYAAATLAFLAALLSKPAAVSVPVILLVLIFGFRSDHTRRNVLTLLPWFVLVLLAAWQTNRVQTSDTNAIGASLAARPLVAYDALSFYLGKLVAPIPLAIDYGRRPEWLETHGWWSWQWLLPGALAAALVFVRGRRVLLVSAAIFVAAILPVMGFVAFRFQFFSTVADRYAYLAMLGPALALAAWLARRPGKAAWAATFAALLLLSVVSFRQAGYWSDSESLYEHSVRHYPDGFLAHTKLALIYAEQGRKDAAIDHYRQALKVKPDLLQANFNLALLLAEKGDLDAAVRHHRAVIKIAPRDANARKVLADVLVKAGSLDEAAELLRGVVAERPRDAMARFRLAEVQYRLGEAEEAIEMFRATLRVQRELLMQIRLAWILATDPDDDLRDGLEAVRLANEVCTATNHQNALALDALAAAYAEVGQFDEAVSVSRTAVRAARRDDDEALVDQLETHLRFYLQGRPFRAERRSGNPIAD